MEQVEQIGEGTEERDGDAEGGVSGHTGGATDVREEEVEWVDEEGNEACDEEHMVPLGHQVAVRVEDLAAAPEGGDGGGEVVVAVVVGLVVEEAMTEVGGRAANYSIHHFLRPWRIFEKGQFWFCLVNKLNE